MGLRIGRFVGAIAIISTVGACAGSSTTPSSAPSASAGAAASAEARDWVHDIDVGGRTLSLACVGPTDSGRPTVVFETGLGGDRGVWADVMTTLQETDRGCSYDRAGLGLSEPAPKPRTTGDQVEDLHSLLAAAGLKPPYILVGHSSGGWNVMVYGDKYPDDVSGVVMVDVRPPQPSASAPSRRCRRRALASPKRSSRPDPRKRGRRIQPEPGGYRPNQERRRGGCEQGFRRPAAGRPHGG